MPHRGVHSLLKHGFFCVSLLAASVAGERTASAAEPTLVWYRAGAGCPEGQSFLARLEQRGVSARLAGVGDRIDFVVTLAADEQHSLGKLERQTEQGTVAMREVEGTECTAVADILALTLVLAVEPQVESSEQPGVAEKEPVSVPPSGSPSAAPSHTEPPRPSEREAARHPPLALGVEGSAWQAFSDGWLVAGGAVAEARSSHDFWLPTASARVVARGGAQVGAEAEAKLWLAALRLEGCPFGIGLGVLDVRPCAAVDAGVVGASAAGQGDAAFWSALAGHFRLSAGVASWLRLEAQAGLLVPLTPYRVETGTPPRTLEKTRAAGLALGLGVTLPLP